MNGERMGPQEQVDATLLETEMPESIVNRRLSDKSR